MRIKKLCSWLAGAALGLVAVSAAAQEPFRLLMPEGHGLTFRAIYTGVEKGWFAEEGLKIEFITVPGGAVNLVPQLAQGAGDLAWAGGYTIIQARARGVPVVGIQSASAESLWSLISHKDAGIRKPSDLKGKTIGVVAFSSATQFMAQALIRAGGLTEADVQVRPIGMGGPALIAQKQVDAYIWFRTQAVALHAKGAPVEVMPLDEHIAVPQDLMLATASGLQKRRAAFDSYLKVLKRAERYNLDPANDDEVNGYQAKYAPQSLADAVLLRALLQETRDRAARDRAKGWVWGTTDPKRLEAAQEHLFDTKVISQRTPVPAMYTNDLLPKQGTYE